MPPPMLPLRQLLPAPLLPMPLYLPLRALLLPAALSSVQVKKNGGKNLPSGSRHAKDARTRQHGRGRPGASGSCGE
jgi:hypothetical protein